MANTTVESLIQKFAESKGTGKERPGKMINSTRKCIHISHPATNVFAFKFQNRKMELKRYLKVCVKCQVSFTLCLMILKIFVLTFSG